MPHQLLVERAQVARLVFDFIKWHCLRHNVPPKLVNLTRREDEFDSLQNPLLAQRTEAIEIDPDPDEQVDWEGELGIVIGRGGRGITAEDAAGHVAGFTVVNDISARGPHRREGAPHDAFRYDWLASKAQDTFCPMGPAVTPRWLLPDLDDQRLRLWVNDELKQDERAGDMLVGWRELVAAASARVTLEPGDVIAAGTPAGVGMPRAQFLRPGDVVRVAIEGIGTLRNPVVTRTRAATGARLAAPRGG